MCRVLFLGSIRTSSHSQMGKITLSSSEKTIIGNGKCCLTVSIFSILFSIVIAKWYSNSTAFCWLKHLTNFEYYMSFADVRAFTFVLS